MTVKDGSKIVEDEDLPNSSKAAFNTSMTEDSTPSDEDYFEIHGSTIFK